MDTGGGSTTGDGHGAPGGHGGTTTEMGADRATGAGGLAAGLLRPQAGDVHRLVGVLLLALWVCWVGVTVVCQPRTVDASRLEEDLLSGHVVAWRYVLLDETDDPSWSQDLDLRMGSSGERGDPVDDDGPDPLTVAYATDTFPSTRVVDPRTGPVSTAEIAASLRSAGVPQATTYSGVPGLDPPTWTQGPGLALVVLFLAALVLGARPRRGTRWFWFWMLFPALGAGVVAYAVLEHLRQRPAAGPAEVGRTLDVLDGDRWPETPAAQEPAAPVRRRRSGLAGLGLSIVLSLLVHGLLAVLIEVTGWVWVVRP